MRSTGERWTLGHRPALDGVRGIAILLVLASHTAIPGMDAAGAVGVTLFFVLSGFLITALLLEEYQRDGQISVGRFYERRARRLLPALLTSVGLVIAVAPFFGSWWFEWTELPAVLLYFGNWLQATPGVSLGALAGTWSLAVEEQFYLLWPLVIVVAARRGQRVVMWAAAVGATGSMLLRTIYVQHDFSPERIYHGTDMVALPLLAGAALAAWRLSSPVRPLSRAPMFAGALILLTPVGWTGPAGPVAGPVVATLGALLLLLGAASRVRVGVLEAQPLRWLGQRSYGIYLYHVPLSMLFKGHLGWDWAQLVVVIVPASLLLAEASYRWVESPFRRRTAKAHAQPTATIHAT